MITNERFSMVVGITLGVLFILAINVGPLLATYLIGRYLANYFGF